MNKTEQPNDFMSPIGRLINELNDQLMIATHIEQSTTALRNTPSLLKTIKKIPEVNQQTELMKGINYLEEHTKATIQQTNKILVDDFSKTNSQILTAMWNSLLTSIENIQTKLLLKTEVRQDIIASAKLTKKWQGQLARETDEDELRFFLKGWKTSGNNIVEYIESKWAYFDLSAPVANDVKAELIEMHQLRNCLVHRAGIVDKKTAEQASTLKLTVGQPLTISKSMLLKYHKAAGNYAVSLLCRIPKCKYTYIKPKSK
ncbi:hypothetical protein [Marinicella rhabdoformis]|uniref:hypothetical protein n=1 Tax=Marinicella rhabdoformis TaxID=2580566 RepID=UPI0012AEC0BA|nr:hypothetical protein [Marinicella rhabdoformis]